MARLTGQAGLGRIDPIDLLLTVISVIIVITAILTAGATIVNAAQTGSGTPLVNADALSALVISFIPVIFFLSGIAVAALLVIATRRRR